MDGLVAGEKLFVRLGAGFGWFEGFNNFPPKPLSQGSLLCADRMLAVAGFDERSGELIHFFAYFWNDLIQIGGELVWSLVRHSIYPRFF